MVVAAATLHASALFYLLEGKEPWAQEVKEHLQRLAAEVLSGCVIVGIALSRLSWLECRVGPLRSSDDATLGRFDAFFARPELRWVELSPAVVERATSLHALHNIRTPDALQAACCLQLGPEALMVSGDGAFARVPGLALLLVEGSSPEAQTGIESLHRVKRLG